MKTRENYIKALNHKRGDNYQVGPAYLYSEILATLAGRCPKCRGSATLYKRSDSILCVCENYNCWYRFGTLFTEG